MYTLADAHKVASKQSKLAREERFVLYVPGVTGESLSDFLYDVVSPVELETFYAGYRDSDILDCYVNGERQL